MLNIVLFGPPGAGKGTQSAKLIRQYNLIHLSTGDIFRNNIKGGTALGNMAKSFMDKGQLVPDEVTIGMLESEVNKHPKANGYIFDGFPRTPEQARALDRLMKSKKTSITMMLALEVEENELKKRLLLRGQDSDRADDKDPAVIQNRINVYNSQTAPVKEYYADQHKYFSVNGIGSVDEIFDSLCAAIEHNAISGVKTKTKPAKNKKKPAVKKTAKKAKAAEKKVEKKKKAPAKKEEKGKGKKKSTTKKVAKSTAKKAAKKSTKKSAPKKSAKKVTKAAAKKGTKKTLKKSAVKKKTIKPATRKTSKKAAAKPAKKTKVKSLKKASAKAVKKTPLSSKRLAKVFKKEIKQVKKVARKATKKLPARKKK